MRLVAFVALLPLAAFAQIPNPETAPDTPVPPPPASPAPVAPAPRAAPTAPVAAPPAAAPAVPAPAAQGAAWSIGAGVSTGVVIVTSTDSGTFVERDGPAVTTSLERRIGGTSWLVLGLDASYAVSKEEIDGTSYYGPSTHETKDRLLLVSAGVRHVVTRPGVAAEVSIVALATLGALHHEEDASYPYVSGTLKASGWTGGAELGIAVERALTGALALRVATPLVSAAYTSTTYSQPGGPDVTYQDTLLRAVLAPRLELRLAF